MTRSFALVPFWLVLLAACAWPAMAAGDEAASGPVRDAQTEVELIAEQTAVRPGQPVTVALRMKPDDGWHTYWKNPGGSGTVTTLAWQLPDGFEAGEVQWPTPQRHQYFGIQNYGFEREFILPVTIRVPDEVQGDTVRIVVDANWLTCEAVCIPGSARLAIVLPITQDQPEADPRWAGLFEQHREQVPVEPSGTVRAHREGNQPYLQFDAPDQEPVDDAYFFHADAGLVDYSAEQPLASSEGSHTLRLPLSQRNIVVDDLPDRLRGVLVFEQDDERHAWQIDVELADQLSAAPAAADASLPALLWMLGAAFLGGMILNLMPCVFPVLSLKVLSFLQHSHGSAWAARLHGLSYGAGVMLSFWTLAALLLALRAAGGEVGWGFQLQSPGFVALMALLMFAVGLNLAGVFDIGIGLMNAAGHAEQKVGGTGYAGSLGTGVLATVLATPCTAPFMGVALGFALTQPATIVVLVLSALGLGMAMPYVVLTWAPGLTRWLPRSGPWMETFKQLLAFPMFAVAIWLVWVFGNQVDAGDATLMLLAALLVLALAAWLFGRFGRPTKPTGTRWVSGAAALALVGVAVFTPFWTIQRAAAADGLAWEPYSEQRIAEIRRDEGRMVFVDFTADWCLSCQWFEQTVLASRRVRTAFDEHDVALLKADWTNHDDHITEALARFGRRSVPFYVLYPADPDGEPIELGELITRSGVEQALMDAAGADGSQLTRAAER